jgi:copper chaperone CopZ
MPNYSPPPSKVSLDALAYSTHYDEESLFIVCGICGVEGSRHGCKLLHDVADLINLSGIRDKFIFLTTPNEYSSRYDQIFILEMNKYFSDGIIKGSEYICSVCFNILKGKKKNVSSSDVSCEDSSLPRSAVDLNVVSNIVDPDSSIHVVESSDCYIRIPKTALFFGMFTGCVPMELTGLSPVEDSMINIYSAITKVCLAGGKHYKLQPGTSYTIINDLTRVAKFLPRMPSIEDTAIMRHKTSRIGKEYTYRPHKVYCALLWLKKNNHLYMDIELVWGDDLSYWQNTNSHVDIPYIEITDEDVIDLNDGVPVEEKMSDEFSTNSGIFLSFLLS